MSCLDSDVRRTLLSHGMTPTRLSSLEHQIYVTDSYPASFYRTLSPCRLPADCSLRRRTLPRHNTLPKHQSLDILPSANSPRQVSLIPIASVRFVTRTTATSERCLSPVHLTAARPGNVLTINYTSRRMAKPDRTHLPSSPFPSHKVPCSDSPTSRTISGAIRKLPLVSGCQWPSLMRTTSRAAKRSDATRKKASVGFSGEP